MVRMSTCVLDATLCGKDCKLLEASRWFSLGTPVSSTNKTDCYDMLLNEYWNTD